MLWYTGQLKQKHAPPSSTLPALHRVPPIACVDRVDNRQPQTTPSCRTVAARVETHKRARNTVSRASGAMPGPSSSTVRRA